jgi:hypothetical protein
MVSEAKQPCLRKKWLTLISIKDFKKFSKSIKNPVKSTSKFKMKTKNVLHNELIETFYTLVQREKNVC